MKDCKRNCSLWDSITVGFKECEQEEEKKNKNEKTFIVCRTIRLHGKGQEFYDAEKISLQ